MGPSLYFSVEEIKALRVETDALIQKVEKGGTHEAQVQTDLYSAAEYQTRIKLIEAKMWLGKMLEGLNNPFPAELADKSNVQ